MLRKAGSYECQKKIVKVLAVFILAAIISSCSSSGSANHKDRKPVDGEIKINLNADSDINPNEKGQPAPLNIFIYSVRDVDVFTSADFFEIMDGSSKRTQAASVKVYEAILKPGGKETIFLKHEKDIQTLGVVGAYRNLNDAIWLITWDLPKKNRSWWNKIFSDDPLELNMRFKRTEMTLKKGLSHEN